MTFCRADTNQGTNDVSNSFTLLIPTAHKKASCNTAIIWRSTRGLMSNGIAECHMFVSHVSITRPLLHLG